MGDEVGGDNDVLGLFTASAPARDSGVDAALQCGRGGVHALSNGDADDSCPRPRLSQLWSIVRFVDAMVSNLTSSIVRPWWW